MSESCVVLSEVALCKMLMHVYKHPSQAVNGLLVGHKLQNNSVSITDCFPLFHIHLAFSSPLETALNMLQHLLNTSHSSSQILGYYQASECVFEVEPDAIVLGMRKILSTHCPTPVLCVINNTLLASNLRSIPATFYTPINPSPSSALKEIPSSLAGLVSMEQVMELVNAPESIVDFDDHLTTVDLEWQNSFVMAELKLSLEGGQDPVEQLALGDQRVSPDKDGRGVRYREASVVSTEQAGRESMEEEQEL